MPVIRGHDVQEAAHWLAQGRLVAFPTETVYGLGANARDEAAIAAVYQAKGRPGDHPVIVHVTGVDAALAWTTTLNEQAERLMAHFWPGPLTLILPRRADVSLRITGGQETVAVRCPAHPMAQQLLQAFEQIYGPGAGVIAPSANRFGQVSPTHADHVYDEFADLPHPSIYLLDGAAAQVGIESTIVDVSAPDTGVRILRPGHIQASDIERVLGESVQQGALTAAAQATSVHPPVPRVSGSLKAHYAPRTPLYLFERDALSTLLKENNNQSIAIVSCGALNEHSDNDTKRTAQALSSATSQLIHYEAMPAEPSPYASQLYATLRRLDRRGFDALWFERPPQDLAWAGVNDRLSRAAAAFS